MSDVDISSLGIGESADRVSLARAVAHGLTWRRLIITESFGLFAILMRYVEAGGTLAPASLPVLVAELLSVVPLLILLAALCADARVQRGRNALYSYSICLLAAACAGAAIQCALQAWVRAHLVAHPAPLVLHPPTLLANDVIDILVAGCIAMFVFHSRRSVVRMLNRLRMAELSRVQLEQSLTESRLAAAQRQMDSSAMLTALREIGSLFRTAPQEADARFDSFVESLQSRRSGIGHMKV